MTSPPFAHSHCTTKSPVIFQKCPSVFLEMVEFVCFFFIKLNDELLCFMVAVFHST
jgi:hypothetical protein